MTDIPTTNTPPVHTSVLWVPTLWIDTPHGQATALHRVPVEVIDFFSATPAVSGDTTKEQYGINPAANQ